MEKKRILLITFLYLNGLFAVINTFEDSHTITHGINTPFESITMHEIDVEALLQEDENNMGTGIPMRFAHSFDVDLGIKNSGTWEKLEDGGMIWRLGLYSPNAFGMKVLFDSFWLPEGATLHVFSKFENMSIGPYTYEQNHKDEDFGIPLVKSDHIVIEYYQPTNISTTPKININKVFHAYIDIHNYYNDDGNSRTQCGDNVACSSADPYEDQVNSVIYLEMNGYICSAGLINNSSQDLKPYVLTAWHCVEPEAPGEHNYFTFYFNHESSSCSGSSGYYGHSETGSYLRSSGNINNSSDFALLEMDDDPSSWWDPYFAGWSRSSSAPTISVGIHHPGGYAKEINFDNDQASSCSWDWSGNYHWCLNWDDGGTAGGSSGSPIFNNSKLIVGQLSGGTGADCSGTDFYGKFSQSWSNSSNSSSNLKAWLDPNNTGIYTLEGTYDGATIVYGCTDNNACNYNSEATNNDGSCEYAQGSCDCNGNPTGNYCDCNSNIDDECGVCDGDGSSCSGSVILSFNSIDGNMGTAEILMQNDVDIAGFQFAINDYPNMVDLIETSGGNSEDYGFTLSSSEDGTIVGFTLTGTNIPAGLDVLLVATFESNEDASVELCISDAIFSDANANGIPVTLGSCVNMDLSNSFPGDLNDDGDIDVLDVVILVNIILGFDDPNYAGDLNNDGEIDVIDVVLLVNIILS